MLWLQSSPYNFITQLTKVELIDVSRDLEPVPGGISNFPGNGMLAFCPKRDQAYGAKVFVAATYDGRELARAVFNVRSLPTLNGRLRCLQRDQKRPIRILSTEAAKTELWF
jgi:uncharacterized protein YwqG